MDEERLIPLRVADVRLAVPAGNGVEAGLVVLEEEGEPFRQLRVVVGQPEARAVHVAWSNDVPPRPSTWDLFVTTVSLLDARIARAVLTDVEEGRHYFARLELEREGVDAPLVMTARPSDAVALALRAYRCEILARAAVLDQAGVLADGSAWVPPAAPEGSAPAPAPDDPDEAPIRVTAEPSGPLGSPAGTGAAPSAAPPADPGRLPPPTDPVPVPAGIVPMVDAGATWGHLDAGPETDAGGAEAKGKKKKKKKKGAGKKG